MQQITSPVQQITSQQLSDWLITHKQDIYLLDVREPNEIEICSIADANAIAMNLIPLYLDQIPDNKTIVIYCHHGVRSYHVAQYLIANGFDETQLYNLKGGIDDWALTVDKLMPRY